MHRIHALLVLAAVAGIEFGCSNIDRDPVAGRQLSLSAASANDPATPPFNLEAILRPVPGGDFENGFGLVKFRQSNDAALVVDLDASVRDLAPNAAYQLQRAVDTTLDGTCTGTGWLTLGADNATPRSIMTDDRGFGQAALTRTLPPTTAPGAAFDIHFRVVEANSNPAVVVLQTGCYRFVVR